MSDSTVRQRLLDAVDAFANKKILVLGDIMLDQFVWGEVSRISPEAPVPVVQVEKESFLLGGAANVANNLRSLDAKACLSGIIGNDSFGQTVLSLCSQKDIDTSATVTDNTRPTTLKTRIVARGQQVVRVDRERPASLTADVAAAIKNGLTRALGSCDAVIVSDYNKGVVCSAVMDMLISFSKENSVPTLVDPKPVNAFLYKGAKVITPNLKEAQDITALCAKGEAELEQSAKAMAEKLELEIVLITRGAEGMALWQKDKGLFTIPTMAREVFDVTGAGDTVISLMALGLVAGLSPCEAALVANLAAGIVVGKIGTATVTRQELKQAIKQAPIDSLYS